MTSPKSRSGGSSLLRRTEIASQVQGLTRRMSEQDDPPKIRHRNAITRAERRSREEETHRVAIAAIEAEAEARRRKTERLKAAREATKPFG